MRRVLIGETEVLGEKTSYYLLDGTDGLPGGYGVEIVRGGERSRVNGLAVTPVTLRDVTEDWLLC